MRRPTTGRAKNDGLEVSEARRLKQLEEENDRPKQMVAEQAFDYRALRSALGK